MDRREPDVIKEKLQSEPVLNDPRYITLLSILVLLGTILIWWIFSRRRHVRRAVLLTGISDSGKTLLFVRLAYGDYKDTFTSMKENVEEYSSIDNGTLLLVDIPGQENLRYKHLEQYKSNAKGIMFVVDSETIQKDIRDVAEYLYAILTDSLIQRNRVPVLILCNKQDKPLAKNHKVVKELIEKEMNLLRVTKSSQLQSVDPSESKSTIYLGKQGKDFEISDLANKVTFAESSANTGDDDTPAELTSAQEWMNDI